jgi:hypothetical protein
LALLVFVPGGLIGALLYRGERWPEVVATVAIFCGVYLSYGYRGEESGLLKGLILGPRYFAPLTPLLAFAAAETFPRLGARYCTSYGTSGTVQAVERLGPLCLRLWVIGLMVLAFIVHPVFAVLSGSSERFREAIYSHSSEDSVVVIDRNSSIKFVNAVFGERRQFEFRDLTPEVLEALLTSYGSITIALLDRRDSAFWRDRALENAKILERLRSRAEFELLFEWGGGETSERLRIWRVRSYSPGKLGRRRVDVATRGRRGRVSGIFRKARPLRGAIASGLATSKPSSRSGHLALGFYAASSPLLAGARQPPPIAAAAATKTAIARADGSGVRSLDAAMPRRVST